MSEKPPIDNTPGSSDGHATNSLDRKASADLRSNGVAIKPQQRLLHDPNVTFEEYLYYAERTRAEEDRLAAANPPRVTLKSIFIPSTSQGVISEGAAGSWNAVTELNLSDPAVRATISDEEWTNASRALRTASAAACFYLITTDILGPFVSNDVVSFCAASRLHPPRSSTTRWSYIPKYRPFELGEIWTRATQVDKRFIQEGS